MSDLVKLKAELNDCYKEALQAGKDAEIFLHRTIIAQEALVLLQAQSAQADIKRTKANVRFNEVSAAYWAYVDEESQKAVNE